MKNFGIFPKTRLCGSVGPPEHGVKEGASIAPLVLAVCSIFILLGEASESGNLWGLKLNLRFSAIFAQFRVNPQRSPALYLSVMSRLRHVLRATLGHSHHNPHSARR